nr:alpha-glucosidase/alpha-galactosidase [bacterium]
GADGVVCTILNGRVEIWRRDLEIPAHYGIESSVGDTRGPMGIFRFLRTAPVMLDICKDIRKYCPKAIFLNYTNPMAMLCRVMQGEYPDLTITGLCHSVQGTAEMLAKWIGAPMEEITYTCAGLNHQAFYLDYKWNGKDAYPLIRKAIEDPEVWASDSVRNDMFLALDYYVTESSIHSSEYNPWIRKTPQLSNFYFPHRHEGGYGVTCNIVRKYVEREDTWEEETRKYLESDIKLNPRGHEYAAYIFDACFGEKGIYTFNGNVRNFNIIDNLPYGACVEVPCMATPKGIESIKVGPMPAQLALFCNISAQIEEMAVEASLTGDPKLVYQAICFDPLTSAVLGLRDIKAMVNDMFAASADYLPQFSVKHVD